MAATHALAEPRRDAAAQPQARPLFAWWLWSRDIKLRPAARALKISHEQVRRLCLPFGDPKRAEPDEATARAIAEWTGQIVAPWTFEDTPGARAIGLSGVSAVGREPAP